MEFPYYIIPTSNTTFEMRYEPYFAYQQIEYATEYALVEMEFGTFIMEKAEAEDIENGKEEMNETRFRRDYIQVFSDEVARIRGILENGFASRDEVFEAVYKLDFDKLVKRIKKHMSNLEVSKEEAENIKSYFSKEITSAKTLALKKGEELIEGSSAIPDAEKRSLKNKLKVSLLKLNVDVALTNSSSKKYASMANSEGVRVAFGESEIRMLNNGDLEGFCDSHDFQIVNKSILLHEVGHKIGDIFGNQFGESFTVKFQRECLKELGLSMDPERFFDHEEELYKSRPEDRFERLLFRRGVEDPEKYYGLRDLYKKAAKDFSEESRGGNTRLIGNREETEDSLYEYAEVNLDRDKSLQEVFDENVKNNHLYEGRDISVHELITIRYLFESDESPLEEKIELATGFLYESEVSEAIKSKIKENLIKTFDIDPKEYERIERESHERIMEEKTDTFAFTTGIIDYENDAKTFKTSNTDFSKDMLRMSHILDVNKGKEIIDRYYKIAKKAADFGARDFWFSFYLGFIHGRKGHYTLNEDLLAYAKEKDLEFEEHIECLTHNLRDRKIWLQGKEGSEFFIVYSELEKRYRMFEHANGTERTLPLAVDIPREIEKKILESLEGGLNLSGEKITVELFAPNGTEKNKSVILDKIEKIEEHPILAMEQEILKWESEAGLRGVLQQTKSALKILERISRLKEETKDNAESKEEFSRMMLRNEKTYQRLLSTTKPFDGLNPQCQNTPNGERKGTNPRP